MIEKSFYPDNDHNTVRQVVRKVTYSTEPADCYYMDVNVPCQSACPAGTNVPAYIRCLYDSRYSRSYELNRIVNVFPGVLGRICSRPCEARCRHGEPELGKPVNICHIKRAASDLKETSHVYMEQLLAPLGKRVCVVGAGSLARRLDLRSDHWRCRTTRACPRA